MDTIKTATGKIFECDFLATIPSPEFAFIRIIAPIATVAEVFSNPEETVEMLYEDIFLSGYTKLVSIIPEPGAIKISLEKER